MKQHSYRNPVTGAVMKIWPSTWRDRAHRIHEHDNYYPNLQSSGYRPDETDVTPPPPWLQKTFDAFERFNDSVFPREGESWFFVLLGGAICVGIVVIVASQIWLAWKRAHGLF